MGAIFWIVVGAMTGYVCSKMVYKSAEGLMRDVLVGMLGALMGGIVYHRMGYAGPHWFGPAAIMVGVASSVLLIVLYRLGGMRKRRAASR